MIALINPIEEILNNSKKLSEIKLEIESDKQLLISEQIEKVREAETFGSIIEALSLLKRFVNDVNRHCAFTLDDIEGEGLNNAFNLSEEILEDLTILKE